MEIGGTWNTWDTYDEVWDTREKYTLSPKPRCRTLVTRWTLRGWLSERSVTPLALNLPSRRLLHLVANGHKLLRGNWREGFSCGFWRQVNGCRRSDIFHPLSGMSLFIQRLTLPQIWLHQVLTLKTLMS